MSILGIIMVIAFIIVFLFFLLAIFNFAVWGYYESQMLDNFDNLTEQEREDYFNGKNDRGFAATRKLIKECFKPTNK